MENRRYSGPQIIATLKQAEGGVPASELRCKHGISNASSINGTPCLAAWMRH